MKRIILLFFLVFEFKADLVLEITESANKPVKIAILEKNSSSLKGKKSSISSQMILKEQVSLES